MINEIISYLIFVETAQIKYNILSKKLENF